MRTLRDPECAQENAPTQLSKSEKAQQMTLSEDKLSVTSHKGYRMVCLLYLLKQSSAMS